MNGRERDERKLARAYGLRYRATRMMDAYLDTDLPNPRRVKRILRLFEQSRRIVEVRNARFAEIRSRGEWPRA